MLRLGAAATNVLASRAAPTAVRVLPAMTVVAVGSANGIRYQTSCSNKSCCSRCSSTACAAVTPHTCSCSSSRTSTSSGSSYNPTCSRRPRALRSAPISAASVEPLLRNTTQAASMSATTARDTPSSGFQPICDLSAYQSLSLLILLHECIHRAYGR